MRRRHRLSIKLQIGPLRLEINLEPIIVGRLEAACGSKHMKFICL